MRGIGWHVNDKLVKQLWRCEGGKVPFKQARNEMSTERTGLSFSGSQNDHSDGTLINHVLTSKSDHSSGADKKR